MLQTRVRSPDVSGFGRITLRALAEANCRFCLGSAPAWLEANSNNCSSSKLKALGGSNFTTPVLLGVANDTLNTLRTISVMSCSSTQTSSCDPAVSILINASALLYVVKSTTISLCTSLAVEVCGVSLCGLILYAVGVGRTMLEPEMCRLRRTLLTVFVAQ